MSMCRRFNGAAVMRLIVSVPADTVAEVDNLLSMRRRHATDPAHAGLLKITKVWRHLSALGRCQVRFKKGRKSTLALLANDSAHVRATVPKNTGRYAVVGPETLNLGTCQVAGPTR